MYLMSFNMCKFLRNKTKQKVIQYKKETKVCKVECVQGTLREEQARRRNTVSSSIIIFLTRE